MEVLRYILRVTKIASTCFLYGNVAADLLFTKRDADGYKAVLMIAAALAFVSGLANLIVFYRPSKIFRPEHRTPWLRMIQVKLVLSLLLSPLLDKLLSVAGILDSKPVFLVGIIGINAALGSLAMQYRSAYQIKTKDS